MKRYKLHTFVFIAVLMITNFIGCETVDKTVKETVQTQSDSVEVRWVVSAPTQPGSETAAGTYEAIISMGYITFQGETSRLLPLPQMGGGMVKRGEYAQLKYTTYDTNVPVRMYMYRPDYPPNEQIIREGNEPSGSGSISVKIE